MRKLKFQNKKSNNLFPNKITLKNLQAQCLLPLTPCSKLDQFISLKFIKLFNIFKKIKNNYRSYK